MLVFVIWFSKNLLILTETSKDSLNIKYILKGIWDSKTFIYLSWHVILRNWIRIQLFKNKEMFMFFPNRNIWHFLLSTLDNFHIWSKYCLPRMLCWWGNKIPLLPCPVLQKKIKKIVRRRKNWFVKILFFLQSDRCYFLLVGVLIYCFIRNTVGDFTLEARWTRNFISKMYQKNLYFQ